MKEFHSRFLTGFLLIGAGVVFMLNQMGKLEFNLGYVISTYWPVIIIYFSALGLLSQKKVHDGWSGSYLWNLVGLAIGVYFLGRNLGFIELSIRELTPYIIPAILILVGVGMVFKPKQNSTQSSPKNQWNEWKEDIKQEWEQGKQEWKQDWEQNKDDWKEGMKHWKEDPDDWKDGTKPWEEDLAKWKDAENTDPDHAQREDPFHRDKQQYQQDPFKGFTSSEHHRARQHSYSMGGSSTLNKSGWFSDLHLGQTNWELKPMNVSHFIGDTVIDMTTAYIPVGETKINISSFIGDVKIFVPNDPELEIFVSCSTFIGDSTVLDKHESGFLKSFQSFSPGYEDAIKQVRIQVNAFIGDLRIQRVG